MPQPVASRIPRPSRLTVLALAVASLYAGVYLIYVLRTYARAGFSAWDLGIFTQAVKAYAHFRAPLVPLEGDHVSVLGDHFHPWIALIGPLYRLFPSPVTLLVVQALMFAVAIVPITRLALLRFGTIAGLLIGLAYGLAWGIARALSFDFHEIALAVPLLSFSGVALCEQRWRAALLYAMPLVFCKEDLGVTVALIALLVAWRGGRAIYAWSAAVAIWGLGWTIIATQLVIPALGSGYSYESKLPSSIPRGMRDLLIGLADGDQRGATLFLLLVITLFLAVRSPVALLALPTLAWRFFSINFLYWSPGYHYSATLMPIMFVAMIDALSTMRARGLPMVRLRALAAGALVVAIAVALGGPMRYVTRPWFYQTSATVRGCEKVSKIIPRGDSVAATNDLGIRFIADHRVTLFPRIATDTTTPEWIVANTDTASRFPADRDDINRTLAELRHDGRYRLVARADGVVVLRRVTPPG